MNPFSPLVDLLRTLPPPWRKFLYSLLSVVGAGLAALKFAGWGGFEAFTVDQALAVYTTFSSAIGVVAVSNVKRPEDEAQPFIDYYDDDVDLSDFEPVGDGEDVYGQAAW